MFRIGWLWKDKYTYSHNKNGEAYTHDPTYCIKDDWKNWFNLYDIWTDRLLLFKVLQNDTTVK